MASVVSSLALCGVELSSPNAAWVLAYFGRIELVITNHGTLVG